MKKFLVVFLIVSVHAAALSSFAETVLRDDLQEIETEEITFNPNAFWFFFGMDTGYSDLSLSTGRFLDGYDFGFKVGPSYYTPDWVYDFTLGFWNTKLAGGNNTVVNSHTAYFEMSPRYRINRNWQIGPSIQFHIGQNSDFSVERSDDSFSTLIGARGLYEFGVFNTWAMRLGFRFLTDIDIPDRQLFAGVVDLQIGFGQTKRKIIDRIQVTQSAPTVPDTGDLILRLQDFQFDLADTKLSRELVSFFSVLGSFLKNNPEAWDNLTISGHADNRGPEPYNVQLSSLRAENVLATLIGGGAPKDRLISAGYGSQFPLEKAETEAAWQQNRRVELNFTSVKDRAWFEKQILKIRDKLRE